MKTDFTNSFYFLRHGETDWNKNHIVMGRRDIPLNAMGRHQAHGAADLLTCTSKIRSIAVSPLMRAMETADIIHKSHRLPVTIIPELKEASFGVHEGEHNKEYTWMNAWKNGHDIEDGENFTAFMHRVKMGFHKAQILPSPVLIVSHGGVYFALSKILGLPSLNLSNGVPIFHKAPPHFGIPWCAWEVRKGCNLETR